MIVGFLLHEIKQIYFDGFLDYLFSKNNLVDAFMIIFYIGSFALEIYSYMIASNRQKAIQSEAFWNGLANLNASDFEAQKRYLDTFYWLNEGIINFLSFFFLF
jgi:hypothetical protein